MKPETMEPGSTASGCTVHFVDDTYDTGPIILQRTAKIDPSDTPLTLAEKVQAAEREAYPEAIRKVLSR
jgi:phosphoribosylglycinamide formyltransferase 1